MIRSAWVLAFGTLVTFVWASRVWIAVRLGSRKVDTLGHSIPRVWARNILWAAGVKVETEGMEKLQEDAPRVLVANHESWFDVFALSATLPCRFRFVGKKELGDIPIFGAAWIGSGHLAIDRSDRASAVGTLQEAARAIREKNLTIVMFPEGTRSADGSLQRFKKGSFVLAIEAQCPVIPVGISGSREVMAKGSYRIRGGTIRIRVGDPIDPTAGGLAARDALLDEAQRAVLALREPEASPESPPSAQPPQP